jgi:PAS domain S-box-containing protein
MGEKEMNKATILIVEDNAILALDLQGMLSRLGYRGAGPLASGEDAITFLSDNRVDLVLMDIELAGDLNGIATAEIFNQKSETPVVFLTGYSQDLLLEKAKIVAPYGYLIKPVPERELAASLEIALHRHSLDRKLTESRVALIKSEERLRLAQEAAHSGTWEWDLTTNENFWSDELWPLYGLERDSCQASYQAWLEIIHPDDRDQVENIVRNAAANGGELNAEWRVKQDKGKTRWLMSRGKPVFNATGEATHYLGIVIDITERKMAEEALRESEAKHRRLFENMTQGVVYQSAHGEIISANPAAERILGLNLSQLLGKKPRDPAWRAVREDGSDLADEEHPSMVALHTGTPVERFVMGVVKPQQNHYTWISVTAVPLFHWGETTPFQVYVTFDDITEQHRAEKNYRMLFQEMLDAFALHEIICDNEGHPIDYRFLAVNPAFEKMTGLRAVDIIGRRVLEVLPGTERRWIETYGRVALTGDPVFFENYTATLKKHFEITAFKPAPHQFACIFADITDRKNSEQERIVLQEKLKQAQKMEAIGTLAGGIAHDFNNILSAILGYTELALEDSQSGSVKPKYLEQVIQAGHRARDLVKQILVYSRQQEAKKIPLQPAAVVEESMQLLRSSIPTSIDFQQDLDPQTDLVFAELTQIQQIIVNLCTNAYHAMEETGGTLTVGLRNKSFTQQDLVNIFGVQPGKFVQLSIWDTGKGISAEVQEKMFDPYFTTKETGKGTGMGLAIVHGIVKSYGGFITCQSEFGTGTVFEVNLPALAEQIVSQTEEIKPVSAGNESILLVDDESMLAEMNRVMLERLGYRVTAKMNSTDALATFTEQPLAFDLVITDQTMPEMTGIDLARRMLQIRPGLPIILSTGYSGLITEEKVKAIGIKGFALKPLVKREIAALVRKVLDQED